jgi:hypothetical protein
VQGTHRPLDKFIAQNAKELTKQGGSITKDGISRATATAGTWVSRFVGSKSWLENAVEQKPIFEDVVRSMSTQQPTDEKDSAQDVPPTKFDKDDSKISEPESPTKKKQKEFQNKDTQAGGREFGQDSMRPSRDTSYSKGGDGRVWEQAKQEARDSLKDWKQSEKKSEHKPTTEAKRDFTTSTSDYIKDKAQQTEKKAEQVAKEAKDKAQQAWEGAKEKAHEWNENSPGERSQNETRSTAEGVKQSVKEKAQQAWESAKDTASTGKEKMNDASGTTIDAVKDKAEKVKEKVQNAWEGVKETVKETIGQTHNNEQNKEQAKQEDISRDQQKK